ncbi:hypothetical protein Tco_1085304 [Tanacetum coccineum]
MSSECNNVKLAIRNDKYEVVCAMCKQCLITTNHDVYMLNYVNGMNSHGFKEKLASHKPRQPRTCRRWSPARRIFDLKGKIIASSKSECQSDISVAMYDNNIGGQSSAATRTALAAQGPQVLQTPMASTTTADTALIPTNSSSQVTNIPNTSHICIFVAYATTNRSLFSNDVKTSFLHVRKRRTVRVQPEGYDELSIFHYKNKPSSKAQLNPEAVIRKHFKTISLDESRSPEFDLFSDQEENFEEEVAETMAKTMEQYMSKTRADYGSGVTRPKIDDKDHFELKGQFLKELRDNTFSGSDHED